MVVVQDACSIGGAPALQGQCIARAVFLMSFARDELRQRILLILPADDQERLPCQHSGGTRIERVVACHPMLAAIVLQQLHIAFVIHQHPAGKAPVRIRRPLCGGLCRRMGGIWLDQDRDVVLDCRLEVVNALLRIALSAVIQIAAIGVIGDHRVLDKDEVQVARAVHHELADIIPGSVLRLLHRPVIRAVGDKHRLLRARSVENAREDNIVGILRRNCCRQRQLHRVGDIGGHAVLIRHKERRHVLPCNRRGAIGSAAGCQVAENIEVDAVQEVAEG